MLDITIYDKSGCRHFIDHVIVISCTPDTDALAITTVTDFGDTMNRIFSVSDTEYIKATVMKGVN